MNILVVSQYFYPESFRVNSFCLELKRRGHNVTVLTGYPQYPYGRIYDGYGFKIPHKKEWNGIHIVRVKTHPRKSGIFGHLRNCTSYVSSAKKWVKKCNEKFDAIYVFEVSPVTVGLPAVAYKKKFSTPMFFNVQDLWPENVEVILGIKNPIVIGAINSIVKKIYKHSDKILCSSDGFIENIKSRGVLEDKLVYWPQFCEDPNVSSLERPKRLSDDTFNIVFAGNIGQAQGLDMLVETAYALREEKIRWFIVGDGRYSQALKEKVSDLCLEDKIIFTGWLSEEDANAYVHFADCAYLSFVPNKVFNMTIPAKLQTYLACGVPVLAAAGGESAAIIKEAECGTAVNPDVDSVVVAVKYLMSLSKEELDKMRENSRAYFEQHFTKEKLVDQFEKLLEDI